jgi:Protein of unknown function (DUF998)
MAGGRLRALAWCGVVGPAMIVLAGLVAGFAQDDTDVRREGLSDLGTATADKAWLWNIPLSIGGVLIVLGAAAVFVGLDRGRRPRVAAALIGAFGAGLALEGALFRLDCRESDVGCEERDSHSWRHVAHEVETVIGFVAVLAAIVLLATWFRRRGPRTLLIASLIASAALVVFVFGWEAIAESAWGGLVQRVFVAIILAWIALVSYRVVEHAGKADP